MNHTNPAPEQQSPDSDPNSEVARRRLIVALVLPMTLALVIYLLRLFAPVYLLEAIPVRQAALDTLVTGVIVLLLFMSVSAAVVGYLQNGRLPLPDTLRWFVEINRRFLTAPSTKKGEPPANRIKPQPRDKVSSPPKEPSRPEPEDERFRYITAHAEELVGRLSKAIEQQRQRNNINVGFGVFITLIGVSALMYFVQDSKAAIDPNHPLSALAFLPRLSLVVLIELFAYFFLNLYRDGLNEMKYLQNELTTVRMRTLGLRAAIFEGHETSAAEIMMAFANTDRNATVGKGKATADNATELLKTAQEAIKVAAKLTGSKAGKD